MFRSLRNLAALPLLLLGAFTVPPASLGQEQEPPPPPPDAATSTLSVAVRVVAIDAVVRDRDGNLIRDLDQSAFTLRVDGKSTDIHYFNRDNDLPLTIGLMIDTSGSQMEFLSDERMASDIFLRNMLTNPHDRAFIVRFSSQVVMLQKMTSKLSELHNGLRLLDYQHDSPNGTLLFDAITTVCSNVIGQEPGRRALVVLTDGGDNGSHGNLATTIHQAQVANVAVYSILYTNEMPGYPKVSGGRRSGIDVMGDISRATGGREFKVGAGTSITDIFAAIAADLRSQYRFGFTPPPSKPGKPHSIDLKPVDKSLQVQARTGYVAP